MGDGRLGDVVARRDIARADRARQGQLAKDGQAGGVCSRLQQQNFGIGVAFHSCQYIDRHLYNQPLAAFVRLGAIAV
jgi:hypothetical protein